MREEHELNQNKAPIYEALQKFRQMRVVPFDVPGHKRGRGNPELTEFLGERCISIDVNSMKPLDNLCHPISVIREAEELAADAFGAAHAFLMVGGTTSSVQTMVLSVCKRGDKIDPGVHIYSGHSYGSGPVSADIVPSASAGRYGVQCDIGAFNNSCIAYRT